MANVSIKFNGKEFLLSCEDGHEEHLEELLIQINKKFNDLKNDLGNLGENKLLLITAVKVMDEYYETKKNVDNKKELSDLSNKFRELKSLIYDYRDRKEKEFKVLNDEHQKLKNEIEINQRNYEKLIDEAADEITGFIEKAKPRTIILKNFCRIKMKLEKNYLKLENKNYNDRLRINLNAILKVLKIKALKLKL